MADGTRWANRVFDGSGTAVNAATINLYDTGTVTPVRATTTTNSTGDFEIDHATRGLFDIEIVNGTTTRRIVQDVEQQFKSMWLWNADADEYALGVTRTEDAASVEVVYFEGDRATMADGDLAYISLRLSDSAGNQDEQARIGWQATTVLNGATQDGDLILSALVNNTLTEFLRLDGSAASINFPSGTILDFGSGDVTITHSANTLTIAGVATRVDLGAGIFELNNAIEWDTGVAVVAGEYSIGRDADATNQLHLNVPTGATFELSVNDVAAATLSSNTLGLPVSGSIISFNAGDVTLTHAANLLTMAGGQFVTQVATGQGIHIDQTGDEGSTTVFDLYRRQSDAQRFGQLEYLKATVGADHRMSFYVNDAEWLRIMGGGLVLINETANTFMTVGLTIMGGAADNEHLALKNSDVGHLMTGIAEADTFGRLQKVEALAGGLAIAGFKDADGTAGVAVLLQGVLGEAADTTDTSASTGVVQLDARVTDGGTNATAVAATGNVLVVTNDNTTRFLIKGNGDIHVTAVTDVAAVGPQNLANATALDAYDDAALARTLQKMQTPRGIIETEWDGFIQYNEQSLIDAGILSPAGLAGGGLMNQSQLLRLHNGALWQLRTRQYEYEGKIAALEGQITELRHRLEAGRN